MSLDRRLGNRLNNLSEEQSRELKLARALEEGRIYGLRKDLCQMQGKRRLHNDWSKAQGNVAW